MHIKQKLSICVVQSKKFRMSLRSTSFKVFKGYLLPNVSEKQCKVGKNRDVRCGAM